MNSNSTPIQPIATSPKSNSNLVPIILSILLSVGLTAGAMYYYFVMTNKDLEEPVQQEQISQAEDKKVSTPPTMPATTRVYDLAGLNFMYPYGWHITTEMVTEGADAGAFISHMDPDPIELLPCDSFGCTSAVKVTIWQLRRNESKAGDMKFQGLLGAYDSMPTLKREEILNTGNNILTKISGSWDLRTFGITYLNSYVGIIKGTGGDDIVFQINYEDSESLDPAIVKAVDNMAENIFK